VNTKATQNFHEDGSVIIFFPYLIALVHTTAGGGGKCGRQKARTQWQSRIILSNKIVTTCTANLAEQHQLQDAFYSVPGEQVKSSGIGRC
jgi:hypothetical protein